MDRIEYLKQEGIEIITSKIAEGGSCYVHKGKIKNSELRTKPGRGEFVAIKEYKPEILKIKNQENRIKQELSIGKTIVCDSIINIRDLLYDESEFKYYLIMDWIEGHTALEMPLSSLPLSWQQFQKYAISIATAIKELHSNNICHRDIKAENIMIDKNDNAILMDIGIATINSENIETLHTDMKDFLGTIRYASPQALMEQDYDYKDDMYSFGALLYYLITGKEVFENVKKKIYLPIVIYQNQPKVENIPEDYPGNIEYLINSCLHKLRERRPDINQFISSINDIQNSDFINNEIDQLMKERKYFPIIKTINNNKQLIVDIGNANFKVDHYYKIIRKGDKLLIPSMNDEIDTEHYIGEAVFRHKHFNTGSFNVIYARWVNGRSLIPNMRLYEPGEWVKNEHTLTPQEGDFIIID